jgi:fructosamine-3-kinase
MTPNPKPRPLLGLLSRTVKAATGLDKFHATPLSNSRWATVFRVEAKGKPRLIAKVYKDGRKYLAACEARMLTFLAAKPGIRVPRVVAAAPPVLLLEFIPNDGRKTEAAERDTAEMLTRLHRVTAKRFGFPEATVFTPFRQPNPWSTSWPDFFREHRLLYLVGLAQQAGRLTPSLRSRLEKFSTTLGERLPKAPTPVLVHGDFWSGNVLFHKGKCAAFFDPAICFAHNEVDLAAATLFKPFGKAFFDAYRQTSPIAPGFFEERVFIYRLWPLVLLAYFFGGEYETRVDGILKKFGY